LDAWRAAGRTATFWWRDDDAREPTQQLDRLLSVAKSVPIALAVIPGLAVPALAERLRDCRQVSVFQHGWRHTNHGGPGRNSEYPGARAVEDVLNEMRDGRDRLSALFGDQFQPVFVPPWHGFDDRFLPLLAQSGIGAISRKGPRKSRLGAAGIFQSNVQAVFLNWTTPPAFIGNEPAIERVLAHLRERRLATCDAEEPTGILTHHLDEDSRSYDFIERLVEVIGSHRAAKWLRASDIFPRTVPT
jgi:hypothetical protein